MQKNSAYPRLLLGSILLFVSYFVWFAIGMSPGGNFSKNGKTKEEKLSSHIINYNYSDSIFNQFIGAK